MPTEKLSTLVRDLEGLGIEVYFYNQSATDKLLPQAAILCDAPDSMTSSVTTLKRTKWAGPKAVEIATSAASRPSRSRCARSGDDCAGRRR
jgi:hypothetical protein